MKGLRMPGSRKRHWGRTVPLYDSEEMEPIRAPQGVDKIEWLAVQALRFRYQPDPHREKPK